VAAATRRCVSTGFRSTHSTVLLDWRPSPPPSPLPPGDSVWCVDTEGQTILLVALLVFCFCMSSALQTAFTFDGTDDARRLDLHSTVASGLKSPSPPPSPLPPGDSVVDTEGKRFCWSLCWSVFCACLPLQTAFTFDGGTDDARGFQSTLYRAA
jgi:hypothetical protein